MLRGLSFTAVEGRGIVDMVHPMYTAASHLVRAHGNAFVHFLVCLWSPPPPSQLNIIILAAPSKSSLSCISF